MPRTKLSRRRSRTSCSLIALATVMAVGPTPAAAESLHGSGFIQTNTGGAANIDQTVLNQTNVTLNPGNTVIDWTPTDNAVNNGVGINFQTVGTSANFRSTGNFAVLNNIVPEDTSRAIHMSGTVNGFVGLNQGGSIYFYSPSGFVFANSSTFNVASLGVSTLPISDASFANLGSTGYGTLTFDQAPNPAASIIMNGTVNAFVPALGFGGAAGPGYVAMVAPRVVQTASSVINANGSTALVAAEAATITFSTDNLFDIQVTVGTGDSTGISVNGNIGGHTPTGPTDKQGVYLVAVPKNQALTMVIGAGADLGFELANTAVDDNGVIILSAGHDIVDGAIGAKSAGHGATGTANLWFTGAHATSNLVGEATGMANLFSVGGTAQALTTFDNDVTVHGAGGASMQSVDTGALLDAKGNVTLSSNRTSTVAGGSATGGTTSMFVNNNGAITIAGNLTMTADGQGGDSGDSILAGNGTGGTISLSAWNNGTITLGNVDSGGNLWLSATGTGGTGFEGGSGDGTGGNVSIEVLDNGDLTVFGDTNVYAEGRGGTNWDSLATAGFGQGGNLLVYATGTGSTLSLTGALMSADGIGGGAGEGTCCAAVGGAGTGGFTSVLAAGGGLIQSNGKLEFSAAGDGGFASGVGGAGTGGKDGDGVFVNAQAGGTITVTGDLELDATGDGGDGDDVGGNGTGGLAQLESSGGTVNVTGETNVDADGSGGDSEAGGDGGDGTGGRAVIRTTSATATLNLADVLIEADGTGGESTNGEGPLGDGGDGFGGRTRAVANSGLIRITGNLEMDATSTGGNGANGGNAVGTVTPPVNEGGEPAAFVWAGATTAELRVGGLTDIDVSATGGTGFNGSGGNASGGEIDIVSDRGFVNLANVTGTTDADGGSGAAGGNGGNANAGDIDVAWAIAPSGPLDGRISMATVNLSATGRGGNGGTGINADTGGNGGNGGNGTGGFILFMGSATGATLTSGATTLVAEGHGGDGGDGGSGDTGSGGNGGAGGSGSAALVQTGNFNFGGNSGSGGSTTYGTLSQSASATGGNGGNGGEGGGGMGTGGNGGSAAGGLAALTARGIPVSAGAVTLLANATGGNGGSGSTSGNGGNAEGGQIQIESKDRTGHATQRASLTAPSIAGTAIALGGVGATNGTSTVLGGSFFRVANGDANIGSLTFNITGNLYDGTFGPDYIQVQDGTGTIGTLNYGTTGQLAIYTTSTGALNVGNLTLSAGNFIDHPTLTGPTTPGTISATNLSVTSGANFFADANLNVTNGIGITVPGSIRFDNATSAAFVDLWAQGGSLAVDNVSGGGNVTLRGGTTVTALNVNSNGNIFARSINGDLSLVNLDSSGSIQLNSGEDVLISGDIDAGTSLTSLANGQFNGNEIDAGTFIDIGTLGGISLGNLTAGDYIDLESNGPITILTAQSGETINLATESTLTTGNLTAGNSVLGQASGAINIGTVSAGFVDTSTAPGAQYRVAFASNADITTQAIASAGNIGFGTPGNLLTGNLNSGGDGILALVGGNITLPTVNASGNIFLADFSMAVLGGDFETFNRAAVLAAEPVLTGGSISITGPLTAGTFVTAAAGTTLNYLTINAGGNVDLRAGSNISGGALSADGDIELDADGNILFTTADAGGQFDFDTGGNINGGNVVAGNEISGDAGGTVTLANLTAGLAQDDDFSVGIKAIGNINVGNVTGVGAVGFATQGNLLTGTINAGDLFLAMVGGNVTTGAVTTTGEGGGQVYIADDSMFLTGGGTWENDEGDFDPSTVLALDPVRTGGAITINGPVDTGRFRAAAGTSLTTGAISSDDAIGLDANGAITTGNLVAGDFVLANGGSITTGSIDASSVNMASTGGNITVNGDVLADGAVALDAFGNIVTQDITAGSIDLLAGGNITTDNLTTLQVQEQFALSDGITAFLFPGASITLEADGDIATDNIDSFDGVYANAGGSLTTGTIDAVDFVDLISGGNMLTGSIDAGTNLFAEAGGTMSLAALGTIAADDIELESAGAMTFGNANAVTEFDFDSGSSVTGGNISAGNQISGSASGAVGLGNLTVTGPVMEGETFSIGIVAGGSITVGNATAPGPIGFGTLSNLTTGNISAGDLFLALVGGNTNINGSITTSGEGSQVYIADDSMCALGGGCDPEDGDFNPDPVLGEEPFATGGSITITGPVSTGVFRASAGTSFTADDINAPGIFSTEEMFVEGISVRAGGLATIDGTWSGPDVNVVSNDIAITANGSIEAEDVELYSTNATQTVVGNGVGGGGYQLSEAEFNSIHFDGELEIGAWVGGGANDLMLFGDLNTVLPASEFGREFEFAVFEEDSEDGIGRMRVVGDMVFNGVTDDDSVGFTTRLFELDAATGSISLFSSGTTLAGELEFQAPHIHVASAQILDQLADNPTYTGYQQDLNEAADVQRPEGVVRAGSIALDVEEMDGMATIYVQNTGTTQTPAGFLVNDVFIGEDDALLAPPGSVNLIINGQIVTEAGTQTGVTVRDTLVAGQGDLTPFTSNSTINGCPLTGACVIVPPPPPPTSNIVDNFIDLINGDPLGDSDFGNEDAIDDNEEGDEESKNNPINPPQPLFDTRPLIPGGDVNDPISGTGNPALLGSGPADDDDDEDENDGDGE